MKKILIIIGALILIYGVVVVGVFIKDSFSPVTVHDTQDTTQAVIYSKVDESGSAYEIIKSDISGTNKQVIGKTNYRTDNIGLIPSLGEVIYHDFETNNIKSIPLSGDPEKVIYTPPEDYMINHARASADKTKVAIALISQRGSQSGKIVILNLNDNSVIPFIEKTEYIGNAIKEWDKEGRIVLFPQSEKDCSYGIFFAYDQNGKEIKNSFYTQSDFVNGSNVTSPDYKFTLSAEPNKKAPIEASICDNYTNGTLVLYAVSTGKKDIIESDIDHRYTPVEWSQDSSVVIYRVDAIEGKAEVDVTFLFDKYVAYNIATKEKKEFESLEDVHEFLFTTFPKELVFYASDTTNIDKPEDKSLYLNNKVFDSIDKLPWSGGPAAFEVLGTINY